MKLRQKKAVDMRNLKLSPEEGFVLSRVDGTTSVKELVALTGFDEGRISDIVGRLQTQGALELDGGGESAASATTTGVTAVGPKPDKKRLEEDDAVEAELRAFLAGEDSPSSKDEDEPEPAASEPAPISEPVIEEASSSQPDVEEPPAESTEVEKAAAAQEAADDADESEVLQGEQRNERNYREIYTTVYAALSRDARVKAAGEVHGPDLLALCFDPDPIIISAIMQNPRTTLAEARLIAFHHRTQAGLEALARRNEIIRDSIVQRRLLRNPQLPTTILNRILGPKMLIDVYKAAIDREIPERTRGLAKEVLRKKFTIASSDEKAALLFKTEGRVLILLVQCSLDAHATNILCSKQGYTMLFVQNLARWSATPPALLVHLLKMPVVRRNIGIKKMILKHPNTPSEAKRNA